MSPESRRILLAMKEHLTKGWCQGTLCRNSDQSVCIYGAALRADGIDIDKRPGIAWNIPSLVEPLNAIGRVAGRSRSSLFLWNDDDTTTQQDVIDAIDKALLADSGADRTTMLTGLSDRGGSHAPQAASRVGVS